MIFSNRQVVWTPVPGKESIAVALDTTFALACIEYELENPVKFAENVWQFMGNNLPVRPTNFLDLYHGLLPKGFYAGHDGLWLALDRAVIMNATPHGPLIYSSHNADRSHEQMWLLRAFSAWAINALTLLEWD